MDTVTLWTRQVLQVLEEIQETGRYIVKEEYVRTKNDTISDYYIELYRWYTKEARKHIQIEEKLEYPIWLSVDESVMLQPVEDTVILKVEVPREEMVYCNMTAWGFRVNYWYIPFDAEDEKKHNDEIKRYGIANETDLTTTDKGNFYPVLKRKILESWERVFTLPPKDIEDTVATTWQIKKEWIKEVHEYGK